MFGESAKYTHKDHTGAVQFSTRLGVGVEFIAAERIGIYLDPSATWFINTQNVPKSFRTRHPVLPAFELGLRVRI